MVKTILPFGNSILRQESEPIVDFDQTLFELLNDLTDTLYAEDGRAGLAAPQIGVLKRVVVMDCGDGKIELINPQILVMQGDETGPESCLSFPGYTGIVKRARYIKLKSMTRDQRETVIEGEGFLARCIQHEIDHLSGVLYIDRIIDVNLFDDRTQQRVTIPEELKRRKDDER